MSTQIYKTYLTYVSPADIYPYSIDEVFIDVTGYLPYYHMSAHEPVSYTHLLPRCDPWRG